MDTKKEKQQKDKNEAWAHNGIKSFILLLAIGCERFFLRRRAKS
jgi:hypothetical protein